MFNLRIPSHSTIFHPEKLDLFHCVTRDLLQNPIHEEKKGLISPYFPIGM
jgi:hypothetical protein